MKKLNFNTRVTPRDSQSTVTYFREIAKYPILTAAEEVELAQRVRKGDKRALDRLVECNLRFVVRVAKCYMDKGLDFPDLVSAGNMGLITAARRYDETRGFKFCTYAVWWIRQSIKLALAKEGRAVKLPANQLSLLSKIDSESGRMEQQLLRTPTRDELSDRLGEDDERVRTVLHSSQRLLSLDAPLSDGDETTRADTLSDSSAPRPDAALLHESLHDDIESLLSDMPQNERSIIRMFFGIDLPRAMSLDEIAMRMELSRERVRQIHRNAIARLQQGPARERLRMYL